MKHFISLLILVLAAALPATAQDLPVIDIHYDGTTATVSIPDDVADVFDQTPAGSAHVRLTSTTTSAEYVYRLSGTASDGSLYIAGAYKLTLELAGVSLNNVSGANGGYAIDCEVGKRIALVVDPGTSNDFADTPLGLQKACLYFKGHPELQGGGSLSVVGNAKHAISAKEYLQIKKSFGTLDIPFALSDGIHCGKAVATTDPDAPEAENNYFRMAGGTVSIANIGGDAIDTDDYGNVAISGGTLSIDVTEPGGKGIKCDNRLHISGGNIFANVKADDAVGLQANSEVFITGGSIMASVNGNGSKAIKANNKADGFFPEGGYANIGEPDGSGPDIYIELYGSNFYAPDGSDSRCTAISTDGDLYICGGSIQVEVYDAEARPLKVDGTARIADGTFRTNGLFYSVRESNFRYDMRLYASLTIDDSLLGPSDVSSSASPRYQLAAFVGDECRGVATPIFDGSGSFIAFYLPAYSREEAGEQLTFRVYDTTTGRIYTAAETIDFAADASLTMPSAPLSLTVSTIPSDVTIGTVARTIDRALHGESTLGVIQRTVDRLLNR